MLGDCKRNNEIRHERIDLPTGGAIRFFNNKENEWKEKRFGRPTLAIQRQPPEVLCNSLNTFLFYFSKCAFSKSFADECLAVFNFKQQIAFVCLYPNDVLVQFIA